MSDGPHRVLQRDQVGVRAFQIVSGEATRTLVRVATVLSGERARIEVRLDLGGERIELIEPTGDRGNEVNATGQCQHARQTLEHRIDRCSFASNRQHVRPSGQCCIEPLENLIVSRSGPRRWPADNSNDAAHEGCRLSTWATKSGPLARASEQSNRA